MYDALCRIYAKDARCYAFVNQQHAHSHCQSTCSLWIQEAILRQCDDEIHDQEQDRHMKN